MIERLWWAPGIWPGSTHYTIAGNGPLDLPGSCRRFLDGTAFPGRSLRLLKGTYPKALSQRQSVMFDSSWQALGGINTLRDLVSCVFPAWTHSKLCRDATMPASLCWINLSLSLCHLLPWLGHCRDGRRCPVGTSGRAICNSPACICPGVPEKLCCYGVQLSRVQL